MVGEPRILYFGMENPLSLGVFTALISAGLPLCAVVLPAPPALPGAAAPALERLDAGAAGALALPMAEMGMGLADLAAARGLPVWALRDPGAAEVLAAFRELRPDVGCVACFSRRLPQALLELPARGFLNLHPSLLPFFRGPEPLFWTFRAGLTESGTTVHVMDDGLDTGPILRQADVRLPLGSGRTEAERRFASVGGPLLAAAARDWWRGELTAAAQPPGPPADPWPQAKDFALSPAWRVERAFHFMRGTETWDIPYTVEAGGHLWRLRRALEILPLGEDVLPRRQGSELVLPFRDGRLRSLLAH